MECGGAVAVVAGEGIISVAQLVRADFFCVIRVLSVVGMSRRRFSVAEYCDGWGESSGGRGRVSVGHASVDPSFPARGRRGLPLCLFASLRQHRGWLGWPCAHRRRHPTGRSLAFGFGCGVREPPHLVPRGG